MVFVEGNDDGASFQNNVFANWFRVCRGSQKQEVARGTIIITPHHIYNKDILSLLEHTNTQQGQWGEDPATATVVARVKTGRE